MVRILLLISFLLVSSLLFSQQKRIDSLTLEFNRAKDDTTKLRLLSDIGTIAFSMNSKFAKKINDSLIRFAKGRSEKYLAQGYKVQGTFFLLDGDYDNSWKFYNLSLDLFRKIKDKKNEAILIGNLGTWNGRKGNRKESKKYHLRAIEINNEINNEKGNIKPYINLAIFASNESDFQNSIEYLIKALAIAERYSYEENYAYIHNQIAINYLKLDSYSNAETHLQKALKFAEEYKDSYALATVHNSLGYLYETRDEDFDNALEHYNEALKYYSLINNKEGMIDNYYNVGLQYIRSHSYSVAKSHFIKGLQLSDSIQSKENKIIGNLHLEHLLIEMGNLDEARKHSRIAEIEMNKISKMPFKNHFYRIAQAYSEKELYEPAFKNIQLYTVLADSLFKKEGIDKISEITTKYQTEKKEKENLALKKQNAEKELAVQRATNLNLTYGILAGTAILGLLGLFYYSKTRRRKLRDEYIINLARAKQKEHEKIGADLHSTKAKELERIAGALEKKGELELANRTREIKENIRLLSHELFQIPFSQEEFDDQIINLLYEYNSDSLKIQHDGIKSVKWKDVEDTVKRNLYLIISEAISNIRNHSKATQAMVKFKKNKKNIEVTIIDDGIGFTEDALKKGHGIGNMRMRAHEINGTISFDRAKNQGSEIGIFITL